MHQWFLAAIVIILILVVLIYNIVYWSEDKILYFPSKKKYWTPDIPYHKVYINVDDAQDVVYNSKDRRNSCEYISAWHFDNFPKAKTVLFAHGNSGNITHRRYIIDMCYKFGLNLLVFDYRGYGKSDSHPNKIFLREDGELAFIYLTKVAKIPNRKIVIWGESIGGVSAVWVASRHKCGGLILICTFSSLDDILVYKCEGASRKAAEYFTGLLSFKLDMIPLKKYLKQVTCPVAIVHSFEDELIPYSCSWINYHSIAHKRKMHVKIRGGHASPKIRSRQLRKILDYFNVNIDDRVDVSEILADLQTFAKRHNNFID